MFKYNKYISNYGAKKLLGYIKNLPVFKILYLSVLSAVFLGSILLNIALFLNLNSIQNNQDSKTVPILMEFKLADAEIKITLDKEIPKSDEQANSKSDEQANSKTDEQANSKTDEQANSILDEDESNVDVDGSSDSQSIVKTGTLEDDASASKNRLSDDNHKNYKLLLSSIENVSKTAFGNFHWIIIIGLLLITSISLGISFWMYYIRSIYVKDGPALAPEIWGDKIDKLVSSSQKSEKLKHEILTKVLNSSSEQYKKSDSLLTNFLTLQKTLNEKDEEISRLKKGYDSKIFKRFLMRFIRVNNRVDRTLNEFTDESKSSTEVKNYTDISRMLLDALEECGVEPFSPEIGADYRDMGSEVGENPTPVSTNREEDDFKIASIESIGYIIKGEIETEVIVPAKVSIFRFDK